MGGDRVVGPEEAPRTVAALLGGKAANLVELARAGLPVPPWLALTTRVFESVRARLAPELDRALAGLDPRDAKKAREASEKIAHVFESARLDEGDAQELLRRFDALFGKDARVAVRSSAVGEDSAADSFAGQLDTFLDVPRDEVARHVLRCFASAWSERAILYRSLRGGAKVQVAVVVQLLVESKKSGVLFTANPTTGDRSEAVVSAGLGLGEGVVSDRVETDTYFADLATGAVRRRETHPKTVRMVRDRERGHGTRIESVPEAEGRESALTDDEVAALVALGRRAQDARGGPQDVEWAIDGEKRVFLLQTRPITTLGRTKIFDGSNIVESYPGLSLPLTFSFARGAYEHTFRDSSRALGVPEDAIRANWSVHANLIALVEGRIYYDLLHFYKLFQLVPGFEGVLPAWEKALGLPPGTVPPVAVATGWRKVLQFPIKFRVVSRVIARFFTLTRDVGRFQERFAAVLERFRRVPLAALDAHELVELHEDLCRELLGRYSVSVVNDFFAQQLYELLGKLIARYELGDANALRNDLLCGEKGMESVEPVRSLLDLAGRVRREPELLRAFEDGRSDHAVWDALRGHREFAQALARHLELYGDRTVHELKLETPTLEDDPAFLVASLRSYLAGGQDVGAMEDRERAIRGEAERQVATQLAGRPVKKALFSFVLSNVRKTVSYRENLRLLRSRAFGMVKRIFRALGRLMAARGLILRADDVFYLTVEEVAGAVRGASVTRDLRALVGLRRREYEELAKAPPPPLRVTTRGIAHGANDVTPPPAVVPAGEGVLKGLGCSPGVVTAPAKVVLDPRGGVVVKGEVLVAPATDPGWVFLMVAAGGIVVERGSMLSHTAIIGRELGIPTVVGVAGATRQIKDGETVELDGRAGTVRVLASADHGTLHEREART